MGRSNDALRRKDDGIRNLVAMVGQETINVIDRKAPTETITASHTNKFSLEGMNKLYLYLGCTGANIVATDTFTFKFYIREAVNVKNVDLEIGEITVTTTGVTADQIEKFEVEDPDDFVKNATHYSVASDAGIAMSADCYGVLIVGKQFGSGSSASTTNGALDVNEAPAVISSVPAPEAASDTSDSVALTKAFIKNTGANTIFIRDNGDAADTDDYPLYPGEEIGPLNGTIRFVCDTGLTSTLSILEVE